MRDRWHGTRWLGAGLLLTGCGGEAGTVQPHIVLIVCDTLRADHLDLYGYERETAPHLRQWAEESLVFEQATAPSNWTRASVYSLFTGQYPQADRVLSLTNEFPSHEPRLPEILGRAGYHTLGVSANPYITASFGASRGFDDLQEMGWGRIRHVGAWKESCSAPAVMDQVERLLAARPDEDQPVFLYVQLMDTHQPYDPPRDQRLFSRPDYSGVFDGTSSTYLKLRGENVDAHLHPEDREQIVALYDASIRQVDLALARMQTLIARYLDDRPVVLVMTADHGESFGDGPGGYYGHKYGLHPALVHIPLIASGLGAKGHVAGRMSLIDLMPTLVAMAGAKMPADLDGLDLRDARAVEPGRDLIAYRCGSEDQEETVDDQLAVLRDGFRAEFRDGSWSLWDIASGSDVSRERPEVLSSMIAAADRWRETSSARRHPEEELKDAELPGDGREQLEQLGYAGR